MSSHRKHLPHVTAQLSRTSGPDGRPFRLRISDQDSGVLIAEVELDQNGIADLISTTTAYGTAEVATVEQYGRVGLIREVVSERVPKELTDGRYGDAARAAIEPYAEVRREATGADVVRIDSHREGWSLSLSKWSEPA